jgi:hypothetical protein
VDLFDCLGVVDHPSNGLANVICFQSRCFSNLLIEVFLMNTNPSPERGGIVNSLYQE